MSGPRDYQKDFDRMMQELEAEAKRRANLDREAAWKIMEKAFTAMADAKNWTASQREAFKTRCLDDIFS